MNTRTIKTRSGRALDAAQLQRAMDNVHRVGMPGLFAAVRDGSKTWRGASGVADVGTGRPATAEMRHRIGSITKTFTAAAIMLQVEQGEISLDASVRRYLPRLFPDQRDDLITVRMLLNHTSGIADYLPYAYPSLKAFPQLSNTSPSSLVDNRFKRFHPAELIGMAVAAPAVGKPGGTPGTYSNTNYLLLAEILAQVAGAPAEDCIARLVIERAGLRDTQFPKTPHIDGPHPKMYEAWFGMFDPPRDMSVYDMSWVGPAAALISTVSDLNRFFRLLMGERIVTAASLAQMQHTVPVIAFDGKRIDYGLGLHRMVVPGQGVFWGHDGTVWGAGALSMIRADGQRQLSVAMNLIRWNKLARTGTPMQHPIDGALAAFHRVATCGSDDGTVLERLP